MKQLAATIRQEKIEVLKEALFDAGIRGMTISQVQGCGNQHGWKEYVRGTEVLLNTIPKVKFDIVVDENQVDGLVQVICSAAHTGGVGSGKIFVTPVDDVIRIRTGEHGRSAL